MPTYVYKCETCEHVWEESLKYEDMDAPTENSCSRKIIIGGHMPDPVPCEGKISRIPVMPGFAYDNISSKGHSKKPDAEFNNRLKDIKRAHPENKINVYQ